MRSQSVRWTSNRKSPPGGELFLGEGSPGGEPSWSWGTTRSRAAAGRTAVRALVASAVANHQRAALVTRRRIGLLHPCAILGLDLDDGDRRRRVVVAGLDLERDEVLRQHRDLRQVELGGAR